VDVVFPHEHILLRFNGHFGAVGDTAERWSVGVHMGLPTAAPAYDPVKLQTLVNAAQTAANTLHADAGIAAGTSAWLDYVSGAQIGVLGKYTPAGQLTVISPTTPTAGSGTSVMPWNTAGVVSLRTAQPRGRGSNGRLYWPWLAAAVVGTTGRVSQANVTNRLTWFTQFINALNTAGNAYSAGMKVVVASAVGSGGFFTVTKIRSDGRIDSIERRENAAPSTWSTATIT